MIFKSNNRKSFSKEEAIDLMVSLSATDANSEKKWRGFYNSLSATELQGEWGEYWKSSLMQRLHLSDAPPIPNLEIEVHSMFHEQIGNQVFWCFSI